jgi:hypothetical protein
MITISDNIIKLAKNIKIMKKDDNFVNKLDKDRFESTNTLWNELRLNTPWSVGYVSELIVMREFNSKEEWEEFYYQSGEEREEKINKLNIKYREVLNNERITKSGLSKFGFSFKKMNLYYGRTRECLINKGRILYKEAKKKRIGITEEECIEAVRFRVICQTWNGIKIREEDAIRQLRLALPNIILKKTDGNFDYNYAIDYQLYDKNNILKCGIQIKPNSYENSASQYVQKAKEANKKKNEKYSSQFEVPVFDIVCENRKILNSSILSDIERIL